MEQLITMIQWIVVIVIGLLTSIVPDYSDIIIKIITTSMSMLIGALTAHYGKPWIVKILDRYLRKKTKN